MPSEPVLDEAALREAAASIARKIHWLRDEGRATDLASGAIAAYFAALDRERLVSEVAATIENRCGVVRGIGPAVREALAGLIPTEGGEG